jgi:hypothetical protein
MMMLLRGLITALMYFASGVGVTSMIDKFVPDKLPAGTGPLAPPVKDQAGNINWMKVGLIILAGAIGIMITKFIGKKLNVKILK